MSVTTMAAATAVAEESIKEESINEVTPAQQDIAKLAYALWEARGGHGGSAEEDWFRAEAELKATR